MFLGLSLDYLIMWWVNLISSLVQILYSYAIIKTWAFWSLLAAKLNPFLN